jgi:hypothetical protein
MLVRQGKPERVLLASLVGIVRRTGESYHLAVADVMLFGDESGNLDFSPSGTRYFAVGTLELGSEAVDLLERAIQDVALRVLVDATTHNGVFHASEDAQAVRNQVFDVLASLDGPRVDVTLLEKCKANPSVRTSNPAFVKFAWSWHLRYVLRRRRRGERVIVVLSDVGQRSLRRAFAEAVRKAVEAVRPAGVVVETRYWTNSSHRCLQAADYLLWAVVRKWERNDARSYDRIRHLVASEYDLFERGTTTNY